MVSKQLARRWAKQRRQREEEEQRQRVMVVTEFDAGDPEATMHAMATEILKYRLALRQLVRAIGLADAAAPFGVLGPGPLWRPRRTIDGTPEMPDVAPRR
jgi:HAMP domain-containing protein